MLNISLVGEFLWDCWLTWGSFSLLLLLVARHIVLRDILDVVFLSASRGNWTSLDSTHLIRNTNIICWILICKFYEPFLYLVSIANICTSNTSWFRCHHLPVLTLSIRFWVIRVFDFISRFGSSSNFFPKGLVIRDWHTTTIEYGDWLQRLLSFSKLSQL